MADMAEAGKFMPMGMGMGGVVITPEMRQQMIESAERRMERDRERREAAGLDPDPQATWAAEEQARREAEAAEEEQEFDEEAILASLNSRKAAIDRAKARAKSAESKARHLQSQLDNALLKNKALQDALAKVRKERAQSNTEPAQA